MGAHELNSRDGHIHTCNFQEHINKQVFSKEGYNLPRSHKPIVWITTLSQTCRIQRRPAPSFPHHPAHLGYQKYQRSRFTLATPAYEQDKISTATTQSFQVRNDSPTCLVSFKGSFFFTRSLPLSASLSELPASLLWPFSLGSADTQFSDSLGFFPGCLSHFSFRSWGFSDMSFCKEERK